MEKGQKTATFKYHIVLIRITMATLTARVPDELVRELARVSKEEQLDKSTVVRRLLTASIIRWKEQRAMEQYQKGVWSTEQAAGYAKVSLWRFFEMLKQQGVFLNYDEEELREDLKVIGWQKR